jgi:hypothetical protein
MTLGRYQHYKGNFYEVIGVARDCETLEEMVVYKALYHSPDFGDQALWIRKKSDFLAEVDKGGVLMPRFRFVG